MRPLTPDPRRDDSAIASQEMRAGKQPRGQRSTRPGCGSNTLVALRAPSVLPPHPQSKLTTKSPRTEVTARHQSEPRAGRIED